jgi:predicted Zn-dependent protease
MQGDEARARECLQAEARAGVSSVRDPWQAEVQRRACGLRVRLERSKARLAAGDPEGAWRELEALAARADELLVLDAQCQVLLALGKPAEVLQRLERAGPRPGASGLLAIDRVLALRALGDAPHALAEIEAELSRNPAQPGGHALHGELLFALERFPEAVRAFEEARARGDAELSTALYLGRARGSAGDLPGGLRELEAAAASFPLAPKPWAYRSEFLALDGRPGEARVSLAEAEKRGLEPELVAVVRARLDELTRASEPAR